MTIEPRPAVGDRVCHLRDSKIIGTVMAVPDKINPYLVVPCTIQWDDYADGALDVQFSDRLVILN